MASSTSSAAGQSQAEVVVGLGVVGLDFQGLLVMGDGLVDLPEAGQSHAEVVVGLRVVGLDFQGLPVMGDRPQSNRPRPARAKPRLLWAIQQSGFLSIVVR